MHSLGWMLCSSGHAVHQTCTAEQQCPTISRRLYMCQCDKCTSSRILLCGLTQGWAPIRRRVLPSVAPLSLHSPAQWRPAAGWNGIEDWKCASKGCCYDASTPTVVGTDGTKVTMPLCFYPNAGTSNYQLSSAGFTSAGTALLRPMMWVLLHVPHQGCYAQPTQPVHTPMPWGLLDVLFQPLACCARTV